MCVGKLLWALAASSCRKHSGSRDIHVTHVVLTHVVSHHLRPCAFAEHMAGMHGAEAQKMPLLGIE